MVNYETLLNEIVTQLATVAALGVDVLKLPEVESDYARPTTKPRIIVVYLGSEFGDQRSTNHVVQDEMLNIGIEICYSKMYGNLGILKLQNEVIKALAGYKPTNTTHGLKVQNFKFPNEPFERGLWRLELEFYTHTPYSENPTQSVGADLVDVQHNIILP